MASSIPKSAVEIQGIEFDWLGCDSVGCVALFSTAGAGYAPAEFLRDTDAHDAAIQALLALPVRTEARFFPEVAAGLVNTWQLVAERGLFAYDCTATGGPYRLVAAPLVPAHTSELPLAVADVATSVRCRTQFGSQTVVTQEFLAPP